MPVMRSPFEHRCLASVIRTHAISILRLPAMRRQRDLAGQHAFDDRVLAVIPLKLVLTQTARFWFEATKDLLPQSRSRIYVLVCKRCSGHLTCPPRWTASSLCRPCLSFR